LVFFTQEISQFKSEYNLWYSLFHFLKKRAEMTGKMEKGLKIMGLSTDQLVEQFLRDERGALPFESWFIFWNGLKQKNKAIEVVSKIMNCFILHLQGTVRTGNILLVALSMIFNSDSVRYWLTKAFKHFAVFCSLVSYGIRRLSPQSVFKFEEKSSFYSKY
jgi:hypothetical protein